MAAARAAQIRVALANLIPLFPTRSGGLKDEMPLQAIVFCASHHRAEKDGFEFTAVVGEVTVRLAKDRNDLRHLEPELAVLIGERGPVTLRLVLLPFGRVRPNLDALPSKRSAVACAAYGATHPEATLADPIHDRRALAVVVRPARHRLGRREALRAGGQQEPGNPGCPDGAASGEEVAAVEYDGGHVNFSWRSCSCPADRTTGARRPEFSAVAANFPVARGEAPAACYSPVADQRDAIRRQCSGSGARCRSKLLQPGSDQSEASQNDGRASRVHAFQDNRQATGERRVIGVTRYNRADHGFSEVLGFYCSWTIRPSSTAPFTMSEM